MRAIGNLLALGVLIGIVLGILLITYLALDAILTALKVAAILFASVGVLVLVFIGAMKYYRERNQSNRVIDGSLPIQHHKLPTGDWLHVDMNKLPGAAYITGPNVGYKEISSSVNPEIQLLINQAVQYTRSLAAISPGDDAIIQTRGMLQQPRLPASITKMLPQPPKLAGPPAPALPELPPAPVIVRTPLSTQQMIAAPSPQATKLAIGENDQGEIVNVDLRDYPFLRVHGTTQKGKTALAMLLVAQAIRHGYEVDIYDTKNGADWGIFASHANVIDSNEPAVLIDGLTNELHRYQEREIQLGKHGASNLHDLASTTGQQYRRRLIVIEEMGNQNLSIEALGKKENIQFINTLRRITTKAGATGIHGLYIDQVPVEWDKIVRYNATAICFYLPDHGGKVAGYPSSFKLLQYHCHFEGQVIRAGHLTDSQIRQTIDHVPSTQKGGATGGEHPTNTPIANTPTNTHWEAFAHLYFANNPGDSQRALTRAMAAHAADGREAKDFLGQLSSDLYHQFSPSGNKYQPPADKHGWVGIPQGAQIQ